MIYNRYLENDSKISNILEFLKKAFSMKNILFAILAFALANVTFVSDSSPFSYVLFGVASVFNVPLLLILVFSILGISSTSLTSALIIKLLAFFILFTFVTALFNIQGISRKYSVYFKFMLSSIITEVVFNFIKSTLFTNILGILSTFVIFSILYFVFVAGMYALINFNKGYVYTKEESVAMIAVIAIALTVIKNVSIFSFSIFNVLILVLILAFGWKKGAISGGAAGLIIGLLLTMIMNVSMTYIVTLAFSGVISGILSRFGKVAVVLGFLAGNIYIMYYASEFSELTIRLSELLIASVPLLIIPKSLEVKLSNFFNKNNTLDKTYENVLDTASNIRKKVGAVSEVFENLANTYIEETPEDLKETRAVIKKYIENYTYNTCIDCKRKKECISEEKLNEVVDYIASKLEKNETLDKSMLTFECSESEKIIESIYEIYNSMKLVRLLKKQEKENSIKISNQYKEVSKILSNVANNIKSEEIIKKKEHQKLRDELKFYGYIVYEDFFEEKEGSIEYTFVTDILNNIDKQKKQIISIAADILEQDMTIKLILNSSKKEKSRIKLVSTPAFEVQTGICSITKTDEQISGDSYSSYELDDLKHINILSDGAGAGSEAAKSSSSVITMLEKLLNGGFDENKAIEIINSVVKLKSDDEVYATLDTMVVDLKTADAVFIKLGAAPTYILEQDKVTTINNVNIPVGLVNEASFAPISKKLSDMSIILQVSDGVVNENMDITNNYLTKYLQSVDKTKSARVISDEIKKLIIKEKNSVFDDDITVIVTKVKKTNI